MSAVERPVVSVIVPAYNEALKIMASLVEIYGYLQDLSARYQFELLLIDDGSADETGAIMDAFAMSRPEVRVLRHPVNFRLGQALRFGFGQSKGDFVVVFDSDLSYSVDHIGRMLEAAQQEHARIVVASPYMKGGHTTAIPWRREAMSKGVNRLLRSTAHTKVSTVTGMVRCYDGPFIRSLNLKCMGPEINTEILYKAEVMRARVVEIPAHLDWSDQEERMRSRKVSLRVSKTSKLLVFSSFLFRPIVFFIVPGIMLLLLAVWTLGALSLTVAQEFFAGEGTADFRITEAFSAAWRLRPQSFIVGGFSLVLAVQLISLGVLATQSKRYFEEMFHLGTGLARRLERLETEASATVEVAKTSVPETDAVGTLTTLPPAPMVSADTPVAVS